MTDTTFEITKHDCKDALGQSTLTSLQREGLLGIWIYHFNSKREIQHIVNYCPYCAKHKSDW